MNYESTNLIVSSINPTVRFVVYKMSFGRRLELMNRVREFGTRLEFLKAGATQQDHVEAGVLSAEIDRLYLMWGLKAVQGLHIDGEEADPEALVRSGPEDLFLEALGHVKRSCALTDAEAKN